MEPSQNLLSSDLHIDSVGYAHLHEAARWAKFLSIVGFIFSGFLLLASFFTGTLMTTLPVGYGMPVGLGGAITVIYILVAAFMFYLSLQVYRFGIKTKIGLLNDDQQSLSAGLGNLKMIFRIYGILVVIYLGVIVLALFSGIIAAMFMRK